MLFLFLISLAAAAQQPSIQYVGPGSTAAASESSYLLTAETYDVCLAKAQQLDIAERRVAEIQATARGAINEADRSLGACQLEITHYQTSLAVTEADLLAATTALERVKRHRLVLGSVTLGMSLTVALTVF